MPEVIQVTVKTKTQDLFRFMLFHAYTKLSGLMVLVFGVISLFLLPVSLFVWHDTLVSIALGLIIFIYLIATPLNMLSQSSRQVSSNPVLKNPITYHISKEIFEVQQYTGTARLYWQQVYDVKKTPFDYLFYVTPQQAFVMPIKSVDPEELAILDEIVKEVKPLTGESFKAARKADVERKKEDLTKEKIDPLEKQLLEVATREEDDEA